MATQPKEFRDFTIFLNAFNKESNRGAALSAGAYIDELLREILLAFMLDSKESSDLVDGGHAPLGSFSARASACYLLALIEESEYKQITIIRKIRNEFAHTWGDRISFEKGKVFDLCKSLQLTFPKEIQAFVNTRARFDVAVAGVLMDLMMRRESVQNERRTPRIWPHRFGTYFRSGLYFKKD